MSLPQILETDPWLEDDEENQERSISAYKKLQQKTEKETKDQNFNLTGTVTAIAKISIYTYLVFKIVSKSSVARVILRNLRQIIGKYQSISSICLILTITLLSHIKS